MVSLGADGAFVKAEKNFYRATLPKVKAVNPVGSGDATVAGLAVELTNHEPVDVIIKTGMTTGLLNALEPTTGYINYNDFEHYSSLTFHSHEKLNYASRNIRYRHTLTLMFWTHSLTNVCRIQASLHDNVKLKC